MRTKIIDEQEMLKKAVEYDKKLKNSNVIYMQTALPD